MKRDFHRVGIVQRGHVAMRFIHCAREYNREHGTEIRTIALATDADHNAMFVREADEVVWLGEPFFVDPKDQRPRSQYVHLPRIAEALRSARADAVWFGWAFVPEHRALAAMCASAGIRRIGPEATHPSGLRDKRATKELARSLGIPVIGPAAEAVRTLEEAQRQAEAVGFPLIVKPTFGGAGFAIAVVESEGELAPAVRRSVADAERILGNGECYLERYVRGARLVSVEILADSHGNVWDVGVRDGSVQHAFGKVLDEAPPTGLAPEVDRKIRAWAVAIMRAARYEGVGAVEFLLDPVAGEPLFLEVNARLETAHDVLEATTGIDLVKQEIFVARGGALEGPPPTQHGHALQVRLQARDPEDAFRATPGVVDLFRPPMGPGLRVEASIVDGDEIPPGLGTHIAKLVAFGRSRTEALARLERGLRETTVVLRGGTTNKSFLLSLLGRPEVRAGAVDEEWLDRAIARGDVRSDEHAGAAITIAAIESYEADTEEERVAFLASAARGRPAVRPDVAKKIELVRRGRIHRVAVARRGAEHYQIELGGHRATVVYRHRGAFERRLDGVTGRGVRAIVHREGLRYTLDIEGVAHRIDRRAGGMVRAPSPGIVQSVLVKPGDRVERGDGLVVLEAMKTEQEIAAPFAGTVREVHVLGNVPVAPGAPLVQIEEASTVESPTVTSGASEALGFSELPPAAPRQVFSAAITTLRQAMLGYDVDAREVRRLVLESPDVIAQVGVNDMEVFGLERGLVGLFVDLLSLFRRRRAAGHRDAEDDASEERLITFLRSRSPSAAGLPAEFLAELGAALAHYGVASPDPSPALDDALFWIYRARQRVDLLLAPVTQILERWLGLGDVGADEDLRTLLDRIARVARDRHEALADLALEVTYRLFARPRFVEARRRASLEALENLRRVVGSLAADERGRNLQELVASPYPLFGTFADRFNGAVVLERNAMLEALVLQQYGPRAVDLHAMAPFVAGATVDRDGTRRLLLAAYAPAAEIGVTAERLAAHVATVGEGPVVVELFVDADVVPAAALTAIAWPETVARVTVVFQAHAGAPPGCLSLRRGAAGLEEDVLHAGIHPMLAERLRLSQLAEFDITRLSSAPDVYLFRGVARANAKDERLFAFAEVDLVPVRDDHGDVTALPDFERVFQEALASLRSAQALRPSAQRLHWNRVELVALQNAELDAKALRTIGPRLASSTAGAGLEKVVLRARYVDGGTVPAPRVIEMRKLPGMALDITVRPPDDAPIARLSEYEQKVVRARQRGLMYPHELLDLLTREVGEGGFPAGSFTEYDLEGSELLPVVRPPGQNTANVIVGVIRNVTVKYPEGMTRVILLGDPSKNLGALAEPECRRVLAALDLATKMKVPVEWFALSSGAKIAMDSGTENMDWIADVLRGLIEFTQAGGEVNVVVMGINVGGQPYWNAEATMLLHTRGILVMMPHSAMVLTGKRALDYSGGISAEDDFGIGGYEKIMGVNGQGQYFASDVADACRILLRHYEHSYVHPGERFPRRALTTDPFDRDIGSSPHGGDLETIADVFSATKNPGRKKPFHIRKVMAATIDSDHAPLERWRDMRDAENAVVWDAHLGGYPVCLLGIESEPITRRGPVPADGPSSFTGGTLFPLASKKIARAINAASGCRPVVVLANLSGFDGSPESMRGGQLEFGAEIGRAVVNFDGPIVFCVVSRFHGGAYVVFSRTLNPNLEVAALEGTFASVIGGAPAAGVVFAGEVDARAKADPRVKALAAELTAGSDADRRHAKGRLDDLLRAVRAEKVGQLAEEFDREHSVQRALRVGSLHAIVPPAEMRPWLIAAVERGIARALAVERAPSSDA